jgi:hypothetical protein
MICSLRGAALVLILGLQLSSEAHAAALAEPGPRPQYDESLCDRAAKLDFTWKPRTPDETALSDLLKYASSNQVKRLLDLARGSTPPYNIAAEKIPAQVKARPLGRYQPYFVRMQFVPGNDVTTLLDEFNAYVAAAQLEIDFATTPLYREMIGTFDGNIGGIADFMLCTLCYLKAVKEKDHQAYQRIKQSPRFIAHLQRLWSEGERILSSAQPYSANQGGHFQIDQVVLDAVYSEALISELDRLSVQHLKQQPGA